jgi:hypothetical protein
MKRRRFGLPRGYGRDRYRVRLKSTAPHSPDPQQISLDFAAADCRLPDIEICAKPAACPAGQIDLEEYIASLREKPREQG